MKSLELILFQPVFFTRFLFQTFFKTCFKNLDLSTIQLPYLNLLYLSLLLFLSQYYQYVSYNLNNKFASFIRATLHFWQHTLKPLILLNDLS